MFKGHFKKLRFALTAVLLAVCFVCTALAAACKKDVAQNTDDSNDIPSREDTQTLANGDFEFYDLPAKGDYEYLIKTPVSDSWSSTGSSEAMSGIISTSEAAWAKISDAELADKLDDNDDLLSTDEGYINYNGMKSKDIPYKNVYNALAPEKAFDIEERDGNYYASADGDKNTEDGTRVYKRADAWFYYDEAMTENPLGKEIISNPGTHYNVVKGGDGKYTYTAENGDSLPVYLDDDGEYFFDEDLEKPFSNVLMVHNYASNHNGNYSGYSSASVELSANTSAEISLWVKTSDLYFDKGLSVNDDEDRGAYIEVGQNIGGVALDPFKIRAINTEKLTELNKDSSGFVSSNGWVKYTVYINACDFADSTITITVGLGEEGNENLVEGYAFFDDVQVKKYSTTVDKIDGFDADSVENSFCTLVTDENDKIFDADELSVNGVVTDERNSKDFVYLIDLASQGHGSASEKSYKPLQFGDSNVDLGLTVDETDKDKSGVYYAASLNGGFKKTGDTSVEDRTLTLPKGLRGTDLRTNNDLLAVYGEIGESFAPVNASDFDGAGADKRDYSAMLNEALGSAAGLPGDNKGGAILLVSAYGAPYTAVISDGSAFTVPADNYKIISFWVKTSDATNAATVNIVDVDDDDRSNVQTVSINTTGMATDLDDENEDIFNGWVQCFFFVHNDTEEEKSFKIEFGFGLTSLKSAERSAFGYGWASLANMRILSFDDEKIYDYVTTGDYAKALTFSEDDENETGKFDNAASDTKSGFARPSGYTGYNGGSSNVVSADLSPRFDDPNTSKTAGLLYKKDFEGYFGSEEGGADPEWLTSLVNNFASGIQASATAEEKWRAIFGNSSVQPLVIVNQGIRTLIDTAAGVTEDVFNLDPTAYYTLEDKVFKRCAADAKFDAEKTYYTQRQVMNYGYVGNTETFAADGYYAVSVRVKVSAGAVAYIYLVDNDNGVMKYETPEYTFYYDDKGNVLKNKPKDDQTQAEYRANVAYKLREDGLYEDADGKIYANLYNLERYYNDENQKYFLDSGATQQVNFDDLDSGVIYYGENGKPANHYLRNTDGARIYEYYDGNYYYLVNGKRDVQVNNFDTEVVTPRYTSSSSVDGGNDYMVKIVGDEANAGKWITVNFYVRTGSLDKNYRLELWSGARESTGVKDGAVDSETASAAGSAIIFDYSYVTVDETGYGNLIGGFESYIINEYRELLAANDKFDEVTEDDKTIDDYEKLADKLVADGALQKSDVDEIKAQYSAYYYTYTFYDSAAFAPFNGNTAEDGVTGYDYDPESYSEGLAYFRYMRDTDGGKEINLFADYSAVEQDIELIDTSDDADTDEEESGGGMTGDAWLLLSSILLVIVLLLTLLILLIRNMLKKRRKANAGKVKSNEGKRRRYLKRLGIKKSEYDEN